MKITLKSLIVVFLLPTLVMNNVMAARGELPVLSSRRVSTSVDAGLFSLQAITAHSLSDHRDFLHEPGQSSLTFEGVLRSFMNPPAFSLSWDAVTHVPGRLYAQNLLAAAEKSLPDLPNWARDAFKNASSVIQDQPAMAELREHTVLLHSSTIDAYSWLIWLAGGSWRLSPEGQWLEFERIRARLTQDARVHEWIEFQLDGTPYSPVERHLIAQHIDDQLSLRRLLRPWHQDLDSRDRSGAKALFDRLMADARVTKNVKEAVTKAARLHSDGFVPSRVRMESSWPLPAKVLDKYTRALNQRAQKQDAIRESSQRLQSLTHSLPSEEARDALDNIVGAIAAYGNESHLRVLEELLPVLLKHLEFPEVQDALREIGEAFMRFGSPKIHPRRFVQALLPYLSTVAGQTVLDQFTLSAIRQQVMANREGSRQALVAVGLATPSAGNGDEAMRSQGESLIHLDDQHLSSLFSSMVLEIVYVTDASQMESYFENFVSQLPNAHMRALAISVMASAIGGSGKKILADAYVEYWRNERSQTLQARNAIISLLDKFFNKGGPEKNAKPLSNFNEAADYFVERMKEQMGWTDISREVLGERLKLYLDSYCLYLQSSASVVGANPESFSLDHFAAARYADGSAPVVTEEDVRRMRELARAAFFDPQLARFTLHDKQNEYGLVGCVADRFDLSLPPTHEAVVRGNPPNLDWLFPALPEEYRADSGDPYLVLIDNWIQQEKFTVGEIRAIVNRLRFGKSSRIYGPQTRQWVRLITRVIERDYLGPDGQGLRAPDNLIEIPQEGALSQRVRVDENLMGRVYFGKNDQAVVLAIVPPNGFLLSKNRPPKLSSQSGEVYAAARWEPGDVRGTLKAIYRPSGRAPRSPRRQGPGLHVLPAAA